MIFPDSKWLPSRCKIFCNWGSKRVSMIYMIVVAMLKLSLEMHQNRSVMLCWFGLLWLFLLIVVVLALPSFLANMADFSLHVHYFADSCFWSPGLLYWRNYFVLYRIVPSLADISLVIWFPPFWLEQWFLKWWSRLPIWPLGWDL